MTKMYEWFETHDWLQDEFIRYETDRITGVETPKPTGACLFGALEVCYGRSSESVRPKLINHFKYSDIEFDDAIDQGIKWNNAPERTKAEVIDLCRQLDI
jgi:hypothetical protein